MHTDGQAFLDYLLFSSTNKFEVRFSRIAARLDLGATLDARELSLLYEATFLATLCNLTLNGLGIFAGDGDSDHEVIRTLVEKEFMAACHRFSRCGGMKKLSSPQKCSIQSIFLKVYVFEENLAA